MRGVVSRGEKVPRELESSVHAAGRIRGNQMTVAAAATLALSRLRFLAISFFNCALSSGCERASDVSGIAREAFDSRASRQRTFSNSNAHRRSSDTDMTAPKLSNSPVDGSKGSVRSWAQDRAQQHEKAHRSNS